jgi:hypothetical protein
MIVFMEDPFLDPSSMPLPPEAQPWRSSKLRKDPGDRPLRSPRTADRDGHNVRKLSAAPGLMHVTLE